ncbi:putative thiamine transporter thi9 [Phaeomoniella chlamydospora]|uniref:Putative thiamine transporter thi9 n=1 Tax=Phaeomoniella chlamydospora TaxID=158046 RepID=A0A0G2FWM8_PHACM|nr:putative thiamine transporter thi9 [Phaeomoniella chlamydospora]
MSALDEKDNKISPVVSETVPTGKTWTKDEWTLAKLGYKQELVRGLGLFEGWASIFTSMNFVSGIPVLFGWVMYTGGPEAAFANWTMVGGLAVVVSFAMAEIAAGFPTAGGIYFWSYRLGGEEWGPFLAWMTAWWNWAGWVTVVPGVQQGATGFLLSALEIQYPNASVLGKGWFSWLLTSIGMLFAMAPNIWNQRVLKWYFRAAIIIYFVLFFLTWIWIPASVSPNFASKDEVFDRFVNGINGGSKKQASDPYCWTIGILFGAWVFYGFDASAHISEETVSASENVARSMWLATVSSWSLSVPLLILILFCIQDLDGIINGSYSNNWAEFLVQTVGKKGAVGILSVLWIDSTCATASCFMSAQRVTYAISRDNVLPGSKWFKQLTPEKRMPVHAGLLVYAISVILTTAVIGSEVAFTAITATATIATNFSYLIPIAARHTIGRNHFEPAPWNLGRFSVPIGIVASSYIGIECIVLLLPQYYPVTGQTLNYAPVCIGIVSVVSIVGWLFPVYGGRHWFKGPQKTITELEMNGAIMKDDM